MSGLNRSAPEGDRQRKLLQMAVYGVFNFRGRGVQPTIPPWFMNYEEVRYNDCSTTGHEPDAVDQREVALHEPANGPVRSEASLPRNSNCFVWHAFSAWTRGFCNLMPLTCATASPLLCQAGVVY